MKNKNYSKLIKILENERNLVKIKDENANEIAVPSHGFVRYVDHMGNDSAIVQAARVSYGSGTKTLRGDRGLIRYLLNHLHTTPFEMCFVKFHIKVPLYISKQTMRHRTLSFNEYSGRYSVMDEEVYIPKLENIKAQSSLNKQGRGENLSEQNKNGIEWLMKAAAEHSFQIYRVLNGETDKDLLMDTYEPYDRGFSEIEPLLSKNYPENPVSRELSRGILPTGTYTQFYMAGNLWNFMRFVGLRSDSHAQYEIQEMSNAIKQILHDLFPIAMEAYDDYVFNSIRLSRMERELTKHLFDLFEVDIWGILQDSKEEFMEKFSMNSREIDEYLKKLG